MVYINTNNPPKHYQIKKKRFALTPTEIRNTLEYSYTKNYWEKNPNTL